MNSYVLFKRSNVLRLVYFFSLFPLFHCGFPANRSWIDDLFSTSSLQKHLTLKDEQASSIADINATYLLNQKEYLERLSFLNQEAQKISWSESVDLARMEQVLQESANLEVKLQILAIKRRIEIEKILTPEQIGRLRTLVRNNLIIENKGSNAIH